MIKSILVFIYCWIKLYREVFFCFCCCFLAPCRGNEPQSPAWHREVFMPTLFLLAFCFMLAWFPQAQWHKLYAAKITLFIKQLLTNVTSIGQNLDFNIKENKLAYSFNTLYSIVRYPHQKFFFFYLYFYCRLIRVSFSFC